MGIIPSAIRLAWPVLRTTEWWKPFSSRPCLGARLQCLQRSISPEALSSDVPHPTSLRAVAKIFLAAFSSLSNLHPHLQTCVLVERDFFRVLPHAEHFWDVYCGFTPMAIRPNLNPEVSRPASDAPIGFGLPSSGSRELKGSNILA